MGAHPAQHPRRTHSDPMLPLSSPGHSRPNLRMGKELVGFLLMGLEDPGELRVHPSRCGFKCMDVWMYGRMDAWMYGCMDVWMYGCMDAWMDVCMCGCMDPCPGCLADWWNLLALPSRHLPLSRTATSLLPSPHTCDPNPTLESHSTTILYYQGTHQLHYTLYCIITY